MLNNGYYHTFWKKTKISIKIDKSVENETITILKENGALFSHKDKGAYIFISAYKKDSLNDDFFKKLESLNVVKIGDYYAWKMLDQHIKLGLY